MNYYKDEQGNVLAIFCKYHKKWELLSHAAYSKYTYSASGYQYSCKEGISQTTLKWRAKTLEREPLPDLVPRKDGHGFSTWAEARIALDLAAQQPSVALTPIEPQAKVHAPQPPSVPQPKPKQRTDEVVLTHRDLRIALKLFDTPRRDELFKALLKVARGVPVEQACSDMLNR